MTHDHSALLDQLTEIASLRSDELGLAGVLPEIMRAGLQALIEAEATTKIGAGRYERSADRTTVRNGHRPKTISTPAGDVQVKIPKLRAGSFFPVLLERRRRIDKALYAVIIPGLRPEHLHPQRGRSGARHGRGLRCLKRVRCLGSVQVWTPRSPSSEIGR